MYAYNKYLAELYFYMKEFYNFEMEFKTNLAQNYISGNIACLVDTDEIENWKNSVAYDECLEFLENHDEINFEKKQFELFGGKFSRNKMNFKAYETLNEICHSLKHNKRISIISRQFFCYLNNITYPPTVFNYYTKNNQLIIYFGTGKSIFIPYYTPEKKIDSENLFIIDLPHNKQSFIEAIFKNQNMSDTFQGEKSLSMSMSNLVNYTVDKNSMKKNKTYNFYFEDDDYINNNRSNNTNNTINKNTNMNMNNYINVYYSNNININSSNNSNNNNNMYMNYNEIIDINKPFLKENDKIIIEEYQNISKENNTEKNNNLTDVEKSHDNEKEDNFINNKNDEYNSGYKDTYKDKEIEYNEILKEKNNTLDHNNNIYNNKDNNNNNYDNINIGNNINNYNNINIGNNINNNNEFMKNNNNIDLNNNYNLGDNNINININPNPNIIIEEKKEIKIKEENFITPNGNEGETKEILINEEKINPETNNFNNNIEDKKEKNNKNEINDISHETNKAEVSPQQNKENNVLDNKEENKEIINDNPDTKEEEKIINNNIESNDIDNKDNNVEKFPMIGLDNIDGKSSYINTVLQCLSHTVPLTNFFLNENNKQKIIQNNIAINNPDGPQLSPSYSNIIENLWINNNLIKSFAPTDFIKNLKYLSMSFEKAEENDVGQLVIFILKQLDSELNNNNIENKNNTLKSNDMNEIKNNFYNELANNNSIIYETFFGGVCQITKECQKCKEECDLKKLENDKIYEYNNLNNLIFQINDVFSYIQKNNNKKDNIDIYDCLNYFECPYILENKNENKCEKCGQISNYIITSQINTCPNNLLILLNRDFEKEKNLKYKIDEIIDITEYVHEHDNDKKIIYYLYGIICLTHSSDVHYVAFCKSPMDKMWYKYNDTNVEAVNNLENDVLDSGIPVALFYQIYII